MTYRNDISLFHTEDAFDDYNYNELQDLIWKSIEVLETFETNSKDIILDKIISTVGDTKLGINLFRMVPTSYCRIIIPRHYYSDDYIVFLDDNTKRDFVFSKNRLFNEVYDNSLRRLKNHPVKTESLIINVLKNSIEFDKIKQSENNLKLDVQLNIGPVYFDFLITNC
jgi:hypothetical protein